MDKINGIVVAAMPEEIQAVEAEFSKLGQVKPQNLIPGLPIKVVHLSDQKIWLVQGGIGSINSAFAASTVASFIRSSLHESLDFIISTGTCGGLDTRCEVGDTVIGNRFYLGKADATMIGYQKGQVPGMPPYYNAADRLVELSKQALSDLSSLVTGSFCTSDVFFGPRDIAEVETWVENLVAVDMESASLAQVAYRLQADFLTLRAVSDLCTDDEGKTFESKKVDASFLAAQAVAKVVSLINN